MKINSKLFLNKLNMLGKVYKPKTPFPALTGLLIKDGKATLSNGDTFITTNLDIEDKKFTALIPFKPLKDIFTKLGNNTACLSIEKNNVSISCDKAYFTLKLLDAEVYPKCVEEDECHVLSTNTNNISKIKQKVAFASATNEKKPILTGVNFHASNNTLECVATDTFKLAYLKIDNVDGEFNFTLAQSDLNNLADILPSNIDIDIKYNKRATFTFDDTIYSCKLLEGNYPKIDTLIKPKYEQISILLNKKELLDSLEVLNVFTGGGKTEELLERNILKLSFKNKELTMNVDNNIYGNGTSTINCDYASNIEFKIACDYKMFYDLVKNCDEENIEIKLSQSTHPIFNNNEDNTYIQLVLPVRMEN